MFQDKRFATPFVQRTGNAAVAGARTGQQIMVPTGSCGIPSPFSRPGRKSLVGIDASPASQANAPQGNTNNLVGVAAGTAWAISFTPFCSVVVSRLYMDPATAVNVVVTSIEVAGQNFLLGAGAVLGDLFAETGADFCCSLIEATTCSPNNPVIVRGQTKTAIVGTFTLRGTLIGSQPTTECG